MLRCDCTEILLNDDQGITPTLSAKTKRLRIISQENHVRRMKTAHERKKSQLTVNLSGFPAFLTPKGLNDSFTTQFSSSGGSHDIPVTTSLTQSGKCLSKKLSYSSISINVKSEVKGGGKCTKFTPVKKNETLSKGSVEKHLAAGDAHCDNSMGKHASDWEKNSIIQSGSENPSSANEVEKSSLPNEFSVVSNSTKNRQFIDETTFRSSVSIMLNSSEGKEPADYTAKENKSSSCEFDSPERKNKHKSPIVEKRNSKILQKKQPSASKIPVSLTRLARKHEMSSSSIPDCTPRQNGENAASIFPSRGRSLKGWYSESTPIKQVALLSEKKDKFNNSFRERSENTFPASSFSKQHSFENSMMYPVSTWLDSVVVENQPNKNPNFSQMSSPDGKTYSVCSRHSDSHESDKCLDNVDVGEDLGNEQCHCEWESVGSAEYFDTEETEGWEEGSKDVVEDDRAEKLEDSADKDCSGMLDIDHSTLSGPSEEDMDSDIRKELMYRQLTDYPNTPYFLRYPRYREQKDDSIVRSDGKEMDEALRHLTAMRLKRACNSTPKARSTGEVKQSLRDQAQIFRKECLFD